MRFLLIVLTLLPFMSTAQTVHDDNQLLWEISAEGKPTSYLFGSFHSNDRRLFNNLCDTTYVALTKADVIALETDLFSIFDWLDTRNNEPRLKYDSDGNPYSSSRRGTETTYGDEDGMPQFLDAYFQQYCYNAGKEFVPFETVDFQMTLFDDMDLRPDFDRWNLKSFSQSQEDFIKIYLKGDIVELDEIMKSSLSMFPKVYDRLIVERNIGMAEKLDSVIQAGNSVFCAVGAGHLPGEGGIITLMNDRGYTVRKVTASYSDGDFPAKVAVRSKRFFNYDNDSLGVHIQFPGKPTEADTTWEDFLVKMVYRDMGQGNTYDIEVYERIEEKTGLKELAERHIASPSESEVKEVTLENGTVAYQGIGDSYMEGPHWTRVVANDEVYVVIKAYGGNKFMNSPRAFRFFDTLQLD